MTEDEAKTKWCPHTRLVLQDEDGASNRDFDTWQFPNKASNCIGSACMAWRWLDDEPGCEAGYCGLAGKP